MMKVIIVGLPLFSSYLAKELARQFPNHQFIALNTYYKKGDQAKYLWHLQKASVVHSINGTISHSKVLEMALKKNKKVILHWVGTDLLTAKKDYQSGHYHRVFIEKPVHLTDTPWFVNELKKIGIEAPVYIPVKALQEKKPAPFPAEFSVLCYIPENRAEFYGIGMLKEIAALTPEVKYRVAGMARYPGPLPGNISLMGWIDNMEEAVNESVVTMRFPQNDGLSFFVLESLAAGRYTAYNQPLEYSDFCRSSDDFVRWVLNKKEAFDRGALPLNTAAAQAVARDFDRKNVLQRLIDIYQR